jgi:hypothetical protein
MPTTATTTTTKTRINWGIEPYHEIPVHMHADLPKHVVPIWSLHNHAAARKLAELCRRAFKPYLLSRDWLNSRQFNDNPYRCVCICLCHLFALGGVY